MSGCANGGGGRCCCLSVCLSVSFFLSFFLSFLFFSVSMSCTFLSFSVRLRSLVVVCLDSRFHGIWLNTQSAWICSRLRVCQRACQFSRFVHVNIHVNAHVVGHVNLCHVDPRHNENDCCSCSHVSVSRLYVSVSRLYVSVSRLYVSVDVIIVTHHVTRL